VAVAEEAATISSSSSLRLLTTSAKATPPPPPARLVPPAWCCRSASEVLHRLADLAAGEIPAAAGVGRCDALGRPWVAGMSRGGETTATAVAASRVTNIFMKSSRMNEPPFLQGGMMAMLAPKAVNKLSASRRSRTMHFLVVEDTADVAEAITDRLGRGGHVCDRAALLEDAKHFASTSTYDLVVLDINLPDGSGT
jgi:hypothetical protein